MAHTGSSLNHRDAGIFHDPVYELCSSAGKNHVNQSHGIKNLVHVGMVRALTKMNRLGNTVSLRILKSLFDCGDKHTV